MKPAHRPVALLLALASAACGGQTGLNVRIEPPPAFPAGDAFDAIRVEVSDRELNSYSLPPFPVTPATQRPYRVLVWQGEEPINPVTLDVKLYKTGQVVKQKRCPNVQFTIGELREVVVDLASNADCE